MQYAHYRIVVSSIASIAEAAVYAGDDGGVEKKKQSFALNAIKRILTMNKTLIDPRPTSTFDLGSPSSQMQSQ